MPNAKPDTGNIRLDLEQRTFYRFSILAGQLTHCLAGIYVERFGRPANAWKLLTVVGRFGPMSSGDVAEHTSLEPDKVTRITNRLAEQGLVLRRQEAADRRRVTLSLSAKGRRVYDEIERIRYDIEAEFLSVLEADEREALYGILDKLQVRSKTIFDGKQPWRKLVGKKSEAAKTASARSTSR